MKVIQGITLYFGTVHGKLAEMTVQSGVMYTLHVDVCRTAVFTEYPK